MSVGIPDFNHLNHTVKYDGHVLTLNPLSFRLLKALADANQETLSVNTLISQVWENSTVSNETLKQRVFVLRKSLAEAGIDGLVVQSVRGEGYRLIIGGGLQNEQQASAPEEERSGFEISRVHKNVALLAVTLAFLLVATVFIYKTSSSTTYTNNRVALWTNIKQTDMPKAAASIYANWQKMLLNENADSNIHLVLSDRQEGVLVPVQARRSRIALISYFELINKNEKVLVNLSIVEPRTATILRADSLELTPGLNAEEVLQSHLNGMLKLIASGKLNLGKQHKDNPKHPIWSHLKALAKPS